MVDHVYGDKLCNHDWNLEIVTVGENNKRAFKLGLRKQKTKNKSKITTDIIEFVRQNLHRSGASISKELGIKPQTVSYIKTKKINMNQIMFHDPKNQRLTILDQRFYTKDNENFYPSVTTVLQSYPKGFGYEKWLKENGEDADSILKEAGEQGSKVHDGIDQIIKGEQVMWTHQLVDTYQLRTIESHEQFVRDKEDGNIGKYLKEVQIFSLLEWQMLLRFAEFVTLFNPEFEANEMNMIVDELKLGGTLDIVCMINGERWLIDTKTSNYIHKSHEIQLSAYKKMWDTLNPSMPIDRVGILWLKALTRGADSKGKSIQGQGWQLKPIGLDADHGWKLFEHTRAIWDEENPNYKPKNLIYPDRIRLDILGTLALKTTSEWPQ